MGNSSARTAKTIRMKEEVYYQARVAAVTSRKGLGEWLEEAILEKLDRDTPLTKGGLKGCGQGVRATA